eukprot:362671-Chlamydomonas_euryale.AAC.1
MAPSRLPRRLSRRAPCRSNVSRRWSRTPPATPGEPPAAEESDSLACVPHLHANAGWRCPALADTKPDTQTWMMKEATGPGVGRSQNL